MSDIVSDEKLEPQMNADVRRYRKNQARIPLIAAAMIALISIAMAGCASATKAGDPATRTAGIALDLLVERADDSRAFYRVFPDGTIGYAGGQDARARRITWTGAMTDEQIRQLLALIDEHGWRSREPSPGENPDEVTFRIDLRDSTGRYRYRVHGSSPAVTAVYNHLHDIAMQRFGHIMDSLPRPSGETPSP